MKITSSHWVRAVNHLWNDSSNGKAPDEVIIGGAFHALTRDGFTTICLIGNRGL